MGLSNSPAVFQTMMNRIFSSLLDVCVIIYLDDIIIYSKSREDHLNHLGKVFKLFEIHSLFVKQEKCSFMKESLEFCGQLVSGKGISISNQKRQEMALRPLIRNSNDLRSYLGSCVWFHSFIPDYAEITAPLSTLLRSDSTWKWGEEEEEAVNLLRHLITTAPILKFFEEDMETEVYTDASDFAIGGWIRQKHKDGWHPVIFWSRKMNGAEIHCSRKRTFGTR
jgi:hypothetical protein